MKAELDAAPASPCLGICRLDAARRQCMGCLRTVEEIASWAHATPAEQRAILARVTERRARMPLPTPPPGSAGMA